MNEVPSLTVQFGHQGEEKGDWKGFRGENGRSHHGARNQGSARRPLSISEAGRQEGRVVRIPRGNRFHAAVLPRADGRSGKAGAGGAWPRECGPGLRRGVLR